MPAAHMKRTKHISVLITTIIISINMCGCGSVPTSQTTDTIPETVSVTETSSVSTESSDESEETSVEENSKESEISYNPNYGYSSDTENSGKPESSYETETSETSTYEQTHYEKAYAPCYSEKLNKYKNNFVRFYTNAKSEQNLFKTDEKNTLWYFFNFAQEGTVGVGIFNKTNSDKYNKDYVNDTNVAYTEMYYGFQAKIIDGRTLSVKNYTNLDDVEYIDLKIQYERPDMTYPDYTVTYDKTTLTADLYNESFINGCYAITGTYKYKNETNTCNLYLYVNCKSNNPSDYNFYICHGESNGHQLGEDDSPAKIRVNTDELLTKYNITPEDSLSLNIMYPYSATQYQNSVFDTSNWITKSKKIVANYESTSKAFRATLLHDWMIENMAYDDYRTDYLDNTPRYANHYNTDAFYPSNSHIGVCLDFANIYMIMCRTQGIPCITCENEEETHVWNMICINKQWVEVDITYDLTYHVETEDVNKWNENINNRPYEYYFNCPKHNMHDVANSINKCLHEY